MYGDDEVLYPIEDQNMEVYVSISSLKNKNFQVDSEENEEFIKEYTLDTDMQNKKNLVSYYCTICGRTNLVINAQLEKLPTRVTDKSIIVDTSKYFLKSYLKHGKFRAVRRTNGLDVILEQVGQICSCLKIQRCECGCLVAYYSLNQLEKLEELVKSNFTDKVVEQSETLLILNDSIVIDPKLSQVFIEIPQRQKALKDTMYR